VTPALNRQRLRQIQWALLLLAAVLASLAVLQVWNEYRSFADKPMRLARAEPTIQIERGEGFAKILRRLREAGVKPGYDWHWRALAWEMDIAKRLKAGEYALERGITPRELLQRIADGNVVQYRFTIIEGWSFRDLRRALARHPVLLQTLEGVSDAAIMRQLGADGVPAEGRFLPETYNFTRGTSDFDLLKRAHASMAQALATVWAERMPGLPLNSPEEVLVLASIIEKETGVADERPLIAGVFIRRLQRGMRLQTDPTVIYGLGESYDGNLTRAHLETDTPFNTYTREGLPPAPIALPGMAALRAAVNPAAGDSLYFVSRGDGSHQFSATLDEHNAAVRRYQLKR